jgi:hypothetical protein
VSFTPSPSALPSSSPTESSTPTEAPPSGTPTASPSPFPTAAIIPGDADGNLTVDGRDVDFLISELFDGDGIELARVRDAGVIAAPGVDASDDLLVTAADAPGIIRRIGVIGVVEVARGQ